jgi:hypothetical protein
MALECNAVESSSARDRRRYWCDVYEAALGTNDQDTAAKAAHFVQSYDSLIDLIDRASTSQRRRQTHPSIFLALKYIHPWRPSWDHITAANVR